MDLTDPTPLPTLSTDGWISNTKKKIDRLLTHFWLSEYSATETYKGNIASLPWLVQTYSRNMRELENATQRTLQSYFERYFPVAKVTVVVSETTKGSNKYNINMNIEVTDNAGNISQGGVISQFMETKLETIALMNNEGVYEQKPIP